MTYIDGTGTVRNSEPSPVAPATARRSRTIIYGTVAAGLVIVALTATLIVVLAGSGGRKGDSLIGYGQDPVTVAKKLGSCASPQRFGDTAVRCVMPDGSNIGVSVTSNSTSQDLLVAMLKDQDAGQCVAVLQGVILVADTESALTEAVGIPESFVSRHGGYLLCPVA